MKDKTPAWLIIGGAFLIIIIASNIKDDTETQSYTEPIAHCIKKETYGAFTERDFDRMVEYSVNKEYDLLSEMIIQHRVVNIKSGTKIILVDAGFTTTIIRPVNNERKIWVVTEAVGQCY